MSSETLAMSATTQRDATGVRAGRRLVRMLVTSAGRRVALLRAFRSSALVLDIDLEIFACDLAPAWSSACFEADYAGSAPSAAADDYVDSLLQLVGQEGIALLVPTIDTELQALAAAREQFAAIGCTVAIGSAALVEIARDKLLTARLLDHAGIATPRTGVPESVLASPQAWRWPLIAKPRHGSASRGIRVVRDGDELCAAPFDEPYIVQEMLTGREITMNMYFDAESRLRCAVPHERLSVRGGEVEKGRTVRDPALSELARRVAAAFDRPFGAMCFQAMVSSEGEASVFEINARFGGGYPLAHHAGATFTQWLLEHVLGRRSSAWDGWRPGAIMLRYDDAVFV